MGKPKYCAENWKLLDTEIPPNMGCTLDGDPFYRQVIMGENSGTVLAAEMGRNAAERIVACVNGCKGMNNPGAVPDLVEVVHALLGLGQYGRDGLCKLN